MTYLGMCFLIQTSAVVCTLSRERKTAIQQQKDQPRCKFESTIFFFWFSLQLYGSAALRSQNKKKDGNMPSCPRYRFSGFTDSVPPGKEEKRSACNPLLDADAIRYTTIGRACSSWRTPLLPSADAGCSSLRKKTCFRLPTITL